MTRPYIRLTRLNDDPDADEVTFAIWLRQEHISEVSISKDLETRIILLDGRVFLVEESATDVTHALGGDNTYDRGKGV